MSNQTSNRGGARPGAGRPPAGTVSVLLRLKRETARKLAQAAKATPAEERHGAKSRIADHAISDYLTHADQLRTRDK